MVISFIGAGQSQQYHFLNLENKIKQKFSHYFKYNTEMGEILQRLEKKLNVEYIFLKCGKLSKTDTK
jgi:hypothetical protein